MKLLSKFVGLFRRKAPPTLRDVLVGVGNRFTAEVDEAMAEYGISKSKRVAILSKASQRFYAPFVDKDKKDKKGEKGKVPDAT